MQDCYAGDIGDFGKYGLLRALCGDDLRLGVLWYAFEGDRKQAPNDGKHTSYVHSGPDGHFAQCDPELFELMRTIICEGKRSIGEIEKSGALPEDTLYFSDPLTFRDIRPGEARALRRQAWMQNAQKAVAAASVVFVDPDNGIETASVARLTAKGPKYVYHDDIRALLDGNRSVIVYHHLGRQTHQAQIEGRLLELRARLPQASSAFALRFRRGTARAYFVLPAERHAGLLRARAVELLSSPWGTNEHFDQAVYE
ncbi:MAG: hypothetical protein F4Z08_06625 [Chloroflexi bacterium]|nr:hypothetical protein [Chloroflexota bacterium]